MKKTNFYLSLLLLAIATLAFNACKDEETVDIKDQAVGNYNYRLKIYVLENGQLNYLGSEFDVTGSFITSKNGDKLDVKEGGELMFQATKIAAASNGFVFDVPNQTITDDGDSYAIEGYNGFDLGGTKYHGGYNSDTKKLTSYYKFTESGVVAVVEITGTKQ